MSLIKITQNKTKDENQRNVIFPLDNRHFITVFRNELQEDVLIPLSSIISIKILPINRIYNPSVGLLKDGMKGFMAHRNAGVFSI